MVAAVEGLAARWRGDASAAAVLQLAARSDDPELRSAAAPRRPSVALREALDAALDAAERDAELRSPPRDTPPHAHRRQAS